MPNSHEFLIKEIASMIQCDDGDTIAELSLLARSIVRKVKAHLTKRAADECQCVREKRRDGTISIYRNPRCVQHGIRR